jgi:subtilisin family serine protease
VLVSSILPKGRVFAAGEGKKIVMVSNSTAFVLLQGKLVNPLDGTNLTDINVVHTLSLIYALAIELPPDQTVAEGLADLQNLLLGISGVQVYDDLPVSVLPITPAPPPPVQMYDWGQTHIRVDVAHEENPTVTGAGVKVAILDTGVSPHTDLPTITEGYNALPGRVPGLYADGHGHGTHMAGIIAAREDNNVGLIGAAPQVLTGTPPQVQTQAGADIVAVKVLDDTGKGSLSDVIEGLQWVYNNPQIRLVNMSLGFSTDSYPLKTATQKLFSDHGTIMVASAGNRCSDDPGQDEGAGAEGEYCDTPQTTDIKYPARYQWVLAVTAIDINYQITAYSLQGSKIDIAAPGGVRAGTGAPILSTYLGTAYGYGNGTSQAAAHVTGAIALILQQKPQLSLSQVQVLLCQNARDLGYQAQQQGCGLIDVEKMLAAP